MRNDPIGEHADEVNCARVALCASVLACVCVCVCVCVCHWVTNMLYKSIYIIYIYKLKYIYRENDQ